MEREIQRNIGQDNAALRASARPATIRMLLVEDSPDDADLLVHQLKRDGLPVICHRVDTEPDYRAALTPEIDIIVSDYNLPGFDAPRALDILKTSGLDVPLIVVSGSIGEETAVRMLQAGAADYFLKDRLSRLGQAIQRALNERRLRQERARAHETLRLAEERTRFALEAAQVGTWELEVATGRMHWSRTLEAHHGLAPGQFGGSFEAFIDIIHPDDRAAVREEIESATARRTDANVLYRTVWPDGSVHWISGIGRMTLSDTGKPVRAAGIGLDVTERRELEEQYRQAQKMEAVGQLAGGIAHDFNNLLSVILGYSSVLIDAMDDDSPHRADLMEIRQAAQSAAGLTKQLLAFSRRQMLEPRVIDICAVIRDMQSMLGRLIGEHIRLDVKTTASAGYVRVDPTQIQQVILNLALNARDAMPRGGTLRIDVVNVDGMDITRQHGEALTGPHVAVIVSDTGEGMDAATRARIFEPFFTTKRMGRGTGLGLSTVYGIVKQSNGSLWVESEPGRGSTFKVFLPRTEAHGQGSSPRTAAQAPVGSETILVVEDEPSLRELLQRCLARRGYRMMAATMPAEAIRIAEDHEGPLHLVITDLVMPGMSGQALADRLTSVRPETRVLFMSGYTDDSVVDRRILEGGAPFLQKPFTPDAVVAKVRELLASPARRSEGPDA